MWDSCTEKYYWNSKQTWDYWIYTYEVDGNGARGIRGQGLKTEKNVKVEVILREEKLPDVVEEISRTLFANFAIILYVSDVGILRTEKF